MQIFPTAPMIEVQSGDLTLKMLSKRLASNTIEALSRNTARNWKLEMEPEVKLEMVEESKFK